MLDRAKVVDEQFIEALRHERFPSATSHLYPEDVGLTSGKLCQLFDSQIASRHLDLHARILKEQGLAHYTIGSSGHEGNAVIGQVFRATDMAFLHYRSGALMIERAKQHSGSQPIFDHLLSLVASKDDPISQGRHKVFGSVSLCVPPQTSTIASHLPKAVGAAFGISKAKELRLPSPIPADSVILCSFGDASVNHAAAQAAFNTAQYLAYHSYPLPLIFLCEDNGIGISVATPKDWIKTTCANRQGLHYIATDGLHIPEFYQAAREAERIARHQKRPVFLHVRMVRLLGHAGSDIESLYLPAQHIEQTERQDPLLHTARLMVDCGYRTAQQILDRYEEIRHEVQALAAQAVKRPKLISAAEVMASLAPHREATTEPELPSEAARQQAFGKEYTRLNQPKNLCQNINAALTDLMLQYKNIVVFGEDVAKKGGVYRVTADLQERFGIKRVYDSLLDETSILGSALGLAHHGLLPIPEIQFLAYTHNAEDQIRGEAATLSFFSSGQYTNPMVIRVAGLAYQKGFGGHFHNDNAIGFLREIPSIIIACPSHGEDAAKMLRTAVQLAQEQKRVVVFLEPIALYMTKDLHDAGDSGWLSPYPNLQHAIPYGEVGVFAHDAKKPTKTTIITYGNGYYLSRQAEKILREQHKHRCKIIELRWLAPLPKESLLKAIAGDERILIVDECRKTGSLSEELVTWLVENVTPLPKIARITGEDTFIPIGTSWQYVLPSRDDIVQKVINL